MTLLDLNSITEELSWHGEFKTMHVLVRPSRWSGRNQAPAIMMLTKDVLFYGGSAAMKGKYHRIPFKSIHSVSKRGLHFLSCIEVEYLASEGHKKIFFCPFSGEPHKPSIDMEKLNELHNTLRKALE